MQDINHTKLINIINKHIKKSYMAYTIDNKLVHNVANIGAKIGNIAKNERQGEFYAIAIEFMENIRPLLTDKLVLKLLSYINNQSYLTCLDILNLDSVDQLIYCINSWFSVALDPTDLVKIPKIGKSASYHHLDQWIKSVTHDPIIGKFKIIDIGYNSKTSDSVFPIDWIDRTFNNGREAHAAMDKLISRLGKPSATYAFIYSLSLQKSVGIIKPIGKKYDLIINLIPDINFIPTAFIQTKIKSNYSYVQYGRSLIGFKLDDILEPKNKTDKTDITVGTLVSRMQKCIRRGRGSCRLVANTIQEINDSPNYNLPEHNFLRVSASRQLVWRLYISIIEDCRPYAESDELGLLELLCLSMITQKLLEYKFTPSILQRLIYLAVKITGSDQITDTVNWRKCEPAKYTPINPSNNWLTSISLALEHTVMMPGDRNMLSKYYACDEVYEPLYYKIGNTYFHDKSVELDVILSSYDQHVKTYIILYYQACVKYGMSTQEISGHIWDISSAYNIRYGKKQGTDNLLKSIQKYFMDKKEINHKHFEGNISYTYDTNTKIDIQTKRKSFLALFGSKYRYKTSDVVIAGTIDFPVCMKINGIWTQTNDIAALNARSDIILDLTKINAPIGYTWAENLVETTIRNGKAYVDGQHIPMFDASSLLISTKIKVNNKIKSTDKKILKQVLTCDSVQWSDILTYRHGFSEIVDWVSWIDFVPDRKLIQLVYTKIFNQLENIIVIGPVDRRGNKMQYALDYLYEGKVWIMFNWFSYIYPDTIKLNGALNFRIDKTTGGYNHMVESLQQLLFVNKKINGSIPKITTNLWDHQTNSVNKIIASYKSGIYGMGDASDVGSGKTLTSLAISAELIALNDCAWSGILVLLPKNVLIKIWSEEIRKHTVGFDVIYQTRNKQISKIKRNTIVVTTLALNRDRPISNNWLLVIIDECLSVKNRDALWTENAWRQSLCSKHLLMMSATFFEARINKMYYLLNMLRTDLPHTHEWLDAILLETIVLQAAKTNRSWISNINYFELDNFTRLKYDKIKSKGLPIEIAYSKLYSLIVESSKTTKYLVKQLANLITKLETKDQRCLLYARAKPEAEYWSKYLNIPIYPIKSRHCITTYSDGTFGLNDLTDYDTIVMRPPVPDTIPQIKGRLDRPGQTKLTLHVEYFVLADTIEMGLVLRMNIVSQFVHKYIMPLSKFYELSVNYRE